MWHNCIFSKLNICVGFFPPKKRVIDLLHISGNCDRGLNLVNKFEWKKEEDSEIERDKKDRKMGIEKQIKKNE